MKILATIGIVFCFSLKLAAQAPVISPTTPTVNQGGSITFSCTGGTCGGGTGCSLSGTNGSGGGTSGLGSLVGCVYTAPASVTAQQQLAGWQLGLNNQAYNTRIDNAFSGLTGTDFSGVGWVLSILPSFPINYVINTCPTDSMVFYYNPSSSNGTYCKPSQNVFLSGNAESGWFEARNAVSCATGSSPTCTQSDHHYLKANSQNGSYEDQYQYYPVGNGSVESCPLCNSQSGTKFNYNDFNIPSVGVDAAGFPISPLILRLQEFHAACAGGAGTGTINHALRLTLANGSIGNTFVWPATAFAAGSGSNPYGRRFRLKAAFSEVGKSNCAKVLLHQLKNYGLILADIGFNGQMNIEYSHWTAADIGYFAEVAGIASSNFEFVPDASFKISNGSWESSVNREILCYNSSGGTSCTDINVLGVTVGMLQDDLEIIAGSPAVQLGVVVNGSSNTAFTCTLSVAIGSINGSTCVYTPPATLASETDVTVTATSSANGAVSNTTLLRVWPDTGVYALPSSPAGTDYTDTSLGGHLWKSGFGIGINSQQEDGGCCWNSNEGSYTGGATDKRLWWDLFTGSKTNLADNHMYFIAPAGTYNFVFNSMAPQAAGDTSTRVNFVAQGVTLLSNVDMGAGGVNQFGKYTHTFSGITVGCDNNLTIDEQMAGADIGSAYFNAISSFAIVPVTNTQSSCGVSGPPVTPKLKKIREMVNPKL